MPKRNEMSEKELLEAIANHDAATTDGKNYFVEFQVRVMQAQMEAQNEAAKTQREFAESQLKAQNEAAKTQRQFAESQRKISWSIAIATLVLAVHAIFEMWRAP